MSNNTLSPFDVFPHSIEKLRSCWSKLKKRASLSRIGLLGMAFNCLVPALTPELQAIDFTRPGGGAVTGSASHDQFPPALAFDHGGEVDAARWLPLQAELPNVFIQYDFGRPVWVSTYMIQNQHFNFAPRSPKDWKLQGSQNATDSLTCYTT